MHRCGTYSCIDYFNRVDGLRVLHDLHDASGCAGEHQISRGSFHALLRRRFIRLSRGALFILLGLDDALCDALCDGLCAVLCDGLCHSVLRVRRLHDGVNPAVEAQCVRSHGRVASAR